jgi:hypothetical protein
MRRRRILLASGVALLCGLAARSARAVRDPSELSVGGSAGAHDAHIACGPDVRVRHATDGVHYERLLESDERGRGASMDVRAAVGTVVVTGVSDVNESEKARTLYDNERDRTRVLATGQGLLGWDWGTFGLRGGVGYFGFAGLTNDDRYFRARYYPLPALDMRIGRRDGGFRGDLGFGAPPIPGLARWYSLYGLLSYRFREGGEVGAGYVTTFGGTFDQRTGFVFNGMFPITHAVHVGGFAMIDADDHSKLTGFNWTAGGALRLMLAADE